ncbi:hypothetical protein Fmac_006882 [Flemingia macrophylla]|uniref:Uncharacterized protein n=1 Tax=Flemingia macrophylla TaxID=520843 RepID=A0ABD1NBV0_9FABA
MEGERRKRKIENEEENEEEKMEEFFSLIKRTKDVRDRLSYNKEKTEKKNDERSVWKPTFEAEDFNDMGKSIVSTSHAGRPEKEFIEKRQHLQQEPTPLAPPEENNQHKDNASEHLDLNLSL